MPQLLASILDQVRTTTILDIGITAVLIYWLFSLIRGTSAVRLVIGVTVLFVVYFAARILNLKLLTQILETGGVVGLFALVVVFQPELRRALDRIGRVGSLGWLLSTEDRVAEIVSSEVARAAAALSAEGHGALIVIERETGLKNFIDTGSRLESRVKAELLYAIFIPSSPIHDGAAIVTGGRIAAAGCFPTRSWRSKTSRCWGSQGCQYAHRPSTCSWRAARCCRAWASKARCSRRCACRGWCRKR